MIALLSRCVCSHPRHMHWPQSGCQGSQLRDYPATPAMPFGSSESEGCTCVEYVEGEPQKVEVP